MKDLGTWVQDFPFPLHLLQTSRTSVPRSSASVLKQSLQSVPTVLCPPHTLTARYWFLRWTNWRKPTEPGQGWNLKLQTNFSAGWALNNSLFLQQSVVLHLILHPSTGPLKSAVQLKFSSVPTPMGGSEQSATPEPSSLPSGSVLQTRSQPTALRRSEVTAPPAKFQTACSPFKPTKASPDENKQQKQNTSLVRSPTCSWVISLGSTLIPFKSYQSNEKYVLNPYHVPSTVWSLVT